MAPRTDPKIKETPASINQDAGVLFCRYSKKELFHIEFLDDRISLGICFPSRVAGLAE